MHGWWNIGSISFEKLSEALDIYFGLSGADLIKYHLICRYHDRVSDRLKNERMELKKKAKIQKDKLFSELLTKPIPLYALIKKP